MDKDYAINFVKEYGVVELIDTLYANGNSTTAKDLLNNCWGYNSDEVAAYIEDNWNF